MNSDHITHIEELVTAYRKRLHELELQAAHFGFDCPAHIRLEMQEIYDKIRQFEVSISQNCEELASTARVVAMRIQSDIDAVEKDLKKTLVTRKKVFRLFGIPVWSESIEETSIYRTISPTLIRNICISIGVIAVSIIIIMYINSLNLYWNLLHNDTVKGVMVFEDYTISDKVMRRLELESSFTHGSVCDFAYMRCRPIRVIAIKNNIYYPLISKEDRLGNLLSSQIYDCFVNFDEHISWGENVHHLEYHNPKYSLTEFMASLVP
jgi:hypothetical protein